MMTPRECISKGYMRIMKESPFYTCILMKHRIVEERNLPAVMGTDGKTLYFHPDLIMELGNKEVAEVLKHEAMHVANMHHIRQVECEKLYKIKLEAKGIDFHKTWNIAADLAINSILIKANEPVWANGKFISGGMIPGKGSFQNWPELKTAEWYMKRLVQDMPPAVKQMCAAGSEGYANGQPGLGEVLPVKGNLAKEKQDAQELLAQASMVARNAGNECGSAKSMIAEAEKPADVNWKSELQNFFTQVVKGRPHYRKPNRRHQDTPIIFPNYKTREVGRICILVDMSGSMDNKSVAAVYKHIEDILKANRETSIRLVPFDSNVFHEHVKDFDASNTPIKEGQRKRCGYGGTYFMPAVEYAEELRPAGIIMLTDMYPCDTHAFESHKPTVPFICLSVEQAQFGTEGQGAKPKWCRVLPIKV